MLRGTLVRLLVMMLAGAAGGSGLFFGREAWASRCGVGRSFDVPTSTKTIGKNMPRRLRMPPVLLLEAFGGTIPAAPQPADFVTAPADGPTAPPRPIELGPWRRTRQGWEKAAWLQPTLPRDPPLHPLVVAVLEILLALMGCLATADRAGQSSETTPHPQGS